MCSRQKVKFCYAFHTAGVCVPDHSAGNEWPLATVATVRQITEETFLAYEYQSLMQQVIEFRR